MSKDSVLIEKVRLGLEKIRPFLQKDGGDIELVELTDDNIVKIKFSGSCDTCPWSQFTLKAGVEESIKKFAPEITAVIDVTGH